jgi:hypothetical protein
MSLAAMVDMLQSISKKIELLTSIGNDVSVAVCACMFVL